MTPRHFTGEGINTETGEVIEIAGHVATQGRAHRKKQRRHPMFALVDLARMSQLELTKNESRVYRCIVNAMSKDSGSIARIATGEIADTTGIHPSNVSAVLSSLKKRRIITRERHAVWAVNPWLMYAGSAEDWEAATADAPEPEWSRA